MSPIAIAVPMILVMGLFLIFSKRKIHLNYREGKPEDLPKLKELAVVSYSVYKESFEPEQFKILVERLQSDQLWENLMQKSVPFVCEDYNKIVGMVFFFPKNNPDDIFKEEWSYIRLLGVHPEYTGKGIAKHLTQLCINEAAEQQETILALHTSEYMDAARHIYESLGFKIEKELQPRFGKRYWLYLKNI